MFDFVQNLPPEVLTASVSALPISELRGAIPLALLTYKLSPVSTFFFAVLGNILAALFLLLGLEYVSGFLSRRFRFFDRFFIWLFARTRKAHEQRVQRFGSLALLTLVAIPLPMTGAWTGALVAFVFGIPLKKAFLLISAGVAIAGLIVSLATLGIINLFL